MVRSKLLLPACLLGASLLNAGLLSGCTAADGKWPSLLSPQDIKGAPPASAAPAAPAASMADVPVVPITPPPAAAVTLDTSIAPAATRIQQEARGVAFALERLKDQQARVDALKTPQPAPAANSAAAKAIKAEALKLEQIRADLADSRDSTRMATAQLAVAAVAGTDVRPSLLEAAQVMTQIATARGENPAGQNLTQIDAATAAAESSFAAAEKTWLAQAKALRAILPKAKMTPDDINWNQTQIDLTRINQSARSFSAIRDRLEIITGDIALLSASPADMRPALQRAGTILMRVAERLAENEALVAATRAKIE
jgi:hypothetical protein